MHIESSTENGDITGGENLLVYLLNSKAGTATRTLALP